MNGKSDLLLASSVFTAVMAGNAMAGFNGIGWDVVNHDPALGTTFRVYAMMDQGDRLDSVSGMGDRELRISSEDGFYQNAVGGPTSKEINSNFFAFIPSLEWDSYVTIGALYQDGSPFEGNGLNNLGIDWSSWEAGGDLVSDNGTYFVTTNQQQGQAIQVQTFWGNDTGVLIAQLTVNYPQAFFDAVLQGRHADGSIWQVEVSEVIGALSPPAPGALAVLAIAGFAGPRRRRG